MLITPSSCQDHTMDTVECTCRGDPGAVFLSSTVRSAVFATQGKNMITKASILESLNTFENERRHLHRVFFTDREGTHPDQVIYYPSMDYGADANRYSCQQTMVMIHSVKVSLLTAPITINNLLYYDIMLNGCLNTVRRHGIGTLVLSAKIITNGQF